MDRQSTSPASEAHQHRIPTSVLKLGVVFTVISLLALVLLRDANEELQAAVGLVIVAIAFVSSMAATSRRRTTSRHHHNVSHIPLRPDARHAA